MLRPASVMRWASPPVMTLPWLCSWAAAMAAAEDNKENCERVRDVGERAVTAGGLHLAEGSKIWDAYRSESFPAPRAG